jgi:hypothetical protein
MTARLARHYLSIIPRGVQIVKDATLWDQVFPPDFSMRDFTGLHERISRIAANVQCFGQLGDVHYVRIVL